MARTWYSRTLTDRERLVRWCIYIIWQSVTQRISIPEMERWLPYRRGWGVRNAFKMTATLENKRSDTPRDAAGILGKHLFSVPGQKLLCTASAGKNMRTRPNVRLPCGNDHESVLKKEYQYLKTLKVAMRSWVQIRGWRQICWRLSWVSSELPNKCN